MMTKKQKQERAVAIAGSVLNGVGSLLFFVGLFVGRLNLLWTLLCIADAAAAMSLCLLLPQRFTFLSQKACRKCGAQGKRNHLDLAVLLPSMMLAVRTLGDFHFFKIGTLAVASLLGGGLMAAALYRLVKELRGPSKVIAGVFVVCVLFCFGFAGQMNHWANPHREKRTACEVVKTEQWQGAKNRRSYSCTVKPDQGIEFSVPIGKAAYQELKPGETVMIYIGRGALGLEYAFYPNKETTPPI